jgi:hypothetical protein
MLASLTTELRDSLLEEQRKMFGETVPTHERGASVERRIGHSSRAKVKAPKPFLNPKASGDVLIFLGSLTDYVELDDSLSEATKVTIAQSYLEGDARMFWNAAKVNFQNTGIEVTYALFHDTLMEQYSPSHREESAIDGLFKLRERPGKFDEYRQDFEALRSKLPADPRESLELLLVGLFRSGLLQSTSKLVVLDPTTGSKHRDLLALQTQAKVAAEIASTMQQDQRPSSNTGGKKRGGLLPQKAAFNKRTHHSRGPIGPKEKNPRADPSPMRCFNCQAVGHKSADCPNYRQGGSGSRQGKGQPKK